MDGINASLDLIPRTRGGGWPTEPVTDEGNFIDLVWHECEFREGHSFSYAAHTTDGEYLGCCYLYPLGTRTPLSEELLAHDVDVSWWVTPSACERGYYEKLFRALGRWGTEDFPFSALHFSNRLIPADAAQAGIGAPDEPESDAGPGRERRRRPLSRGRAGPCG